MNTDSLGPQNTQESSSGQPPALSMTAVLNHSASVVSGQIGLFLKLLFVPAAVMVAVAGVVAQAVLGETTSVDPQTLPASMLGSDWLIVVLGIFVVAGFSFYSMASIVHLTAAHVSGRSIGFLEAYKSVRWDSLWLLWIQFIATALTAVVFPSTALVLWFLIASAVPIAILENLAPNEALDRAWWLMERNRLRILLLELIFLAFVAVIPVILGPLLLFPNAPLRMVNMVPWLRVVFATLLSLVVLMPVGVMFAGLTAIYLELRGGREKKTLHVQTASNVN